jgi:hypothetical protein
MAGQASTVVLAKLPPGTKVTKVTSGGFCLVVCEHETTRQRGGGYAGRMCTVCLFSSVQPVESWKPVSFLARVPKSARTLPERVAQESLF